MFQTIINVGLFKIGFHQNWSQTPVPIHDESLVVLFIIFIVPHNSFAFIIDKFNPSMLSFQCSVTFFQAMSVLSLLMSGKQRKEVQQRLAQLNLVPRLSELFDTFIWKHG
jgi:hypothetical protein